MPVSVCMHVHIVLQSRSQQMVASSITLHPMWGDRVSHWTWNLPVQLSWLANRLPESACHHLPSTGLRDEYDQQVWFGVLCSCVQQVCTCAPHSKDMLSELRSKANFQDWSLLSPWVPTIGLRPSSLWIPPQVSWACTSARIQAPVLILARQSKHFPNLPSN